jgi:hypothetical protein
MRSRALRHAPRSRRLGQTLLGAQRFAFINQLILKRYAGASEDDESGPHSDVRSEGF